MAGSESVEGTTILGEDDLQDVRSAVADLAARWKDLGISLGIRLSELNAILSANPHSLSDCLRETLAIWLKQKYNVEKFGKPTWRRLVEAAEDEVGGNNPALAQTIARDHPGAPDMKRRRFEGQQQSRLRPEKGQEANDCTNAFNLPQNIRVMVSNYQPLKTIFAIAKGKCQSEEIRTDEQFSPTVTIVDTATQQPLDCVLLLHGEKPPEVECRTLFCYIAVHVSYCDEHGSHPYPLYHVKSKPCKQGKLPLIFCFHQPGTACVVQLSIHSIADSGGVEYMHHSEECICVVQIIDRNQHGVMKTRDQHRYTGPLATKQFHEIARRFEELYSPSNYEKIKKFAQNIVDGSHIDTDLKAFALCWEASCEIFLREEREHGKELLRAAWEKASLMECENSLLLQGMIHRLFAAIYYSTGESDKALKHIEAAKERLHNAAPSKETALVLYRETVVKWRNLLTQKDTSAEKYKSIEEDFDKLLEHANFVEDYEKPYILFRIEKAKFHLRTLLITDRLPAKDYWPTELDLEKAKKYLDGVSLDMLPSEVNFYAVDYYNAHCDLCLWNEQYSEAMVYVKKAKELLDFEKSETLATRRFNERLKLLERHEEIDS